MSTNKKMTKKFKTFLKDNILLPLKQHLIKSSMFDKKTVIVKMDGGISSQVFFYILGKYFADKGYSVKFDLSWFEECGMDLNNKFVRNYDLLMAFPDISINYASSEEINYYKKHFKLYGKDFENKKAPLYLGKYYDYGVLLKKYKTFLSNNFNPKLDDINREWKNKIEEKLSCGIHVRRGDLNKEYEAYGKPVEAKYFLNAINILKKKYIKEKIIDCKFFFFSDEIDWVKAEIIPKLSSDIQYEIVACNGSDKGYLDLYLMSRCNHFITSLGSFGKFAAILSDNDNSIVILSENDKNIDICKALNQKNIVKVN